VHIHIVVAFGAGMVVTALAFSWINRRDARLRYRVLNAMVNRRMGGGGLRAGDFQFVWCATRRELIEYLEHAHDRDPLQREDAGGDHHHPEDDPEAH
jgi:hypothetical protein